MEAIRPTELIHSIKKEDSAIFSVRWSNDDGILACASGNGFVYTYETNLEPRHTLDCKITENLPISSIRWRPEKGLTKNILLVATTEGGILHWHGTTGKLIHSSKLANNDQALCCDYSSDGDTFAIGCKDTVVRIFDDNTKREVAELRRHGDSLGHGNRIFSAKWLDNNMLFTAGWDNNIYLWDIRTSSVSRYFHGVNIEGDSIDALDDTLVSVDCSMREQLKVWSISQGTVLYSESYEHMGKAFKGYTAQFSKLEKGETLFIGGSGHQQGYFLGTRRYETVSLISQLARPIYSCDFANFNPKLALGCADGTINIYRINLNIHS